MFHYHELMAVVSLPLALGSPSVSSSTTVGERLSFSSVARLGFAAAHDSPALKTEEIQTAPKIDPSNDSSSAIGIHPTNFFVPSILFGRRFETLHSYIQKCVIIMC